jgi:hypothetical protein
MKSTAPRPGQACPEKPIWRRLEAFEKRSTAVKRAAGRLRLVQSIRAGHVRGGHRFH